ncbi:MAG: AAA family ATPase [Planctomycetota bacterium]|nr:MAG: AAA family ATPase [Planctomycetota bacterium]
MYETHFGLKRRPFNAAPDARTFVAVPTALEALEALVHCCQRRGGAGAVIGEAGIGKTLLCQVLAERLREANCEVALIPAGHFPTRRSLLQAVLHELRVGYEQLGEQELRLRLRDWAAAHLHETREPLVLVLDDAHRLNNACLDELRDWLDWSTDGEPLILVVLAGLPSLEEHLAEPANAGLMQRFACHTVLEPLDPDSVTSYVHQRLQQAGAQRPLFTPDALREVAHVSGGLPRAINALCDHALLLAYACEQPSVTAELVRAAYDDLKMLPLPLTPPLESVRGGANAADEIPRPAPDFAGDRERPETTAGAVADEQPGVSHTDTAAGVASSVPQVDGGAICDAQDESADTKQSADSHDHPAVAEARPRNGAVAETAASAAPAVDDRSVAPVAADAAVRQGEEADDEQWAVIEVGAGVPETSVPGAVNPDGGVVAGPGREPRVAPGGPDPVAEQTDASFAKDYAAEVDIVQPPPVADDVDRGGVARDYGTAADGSTKPARSAESEPSRAAGGPSVCDYASKTAGSAASTDIEDTISAEVLDLCVETHQSIRKLATGEDELPGHRELESPPMERAFPASGVDAEPERSRSDEDDAFGAWPTAGGEPPAGEPDTPAPPDTSIASQPFPADGQQGLPERRDVEHAMKAWRGICERLEAGEEKDATADEGALEADDGREVGAYDVVLPEAERQPAPVSPDESASAPTAPSAASGGERSNENESEPAGESDAAAVGASDGHGIVLDIPAERAGQAVLPRRQGPAATEESQNASPAQHGIHHADALELAQLTRRLAELFLHRRGPADER